MYAWSIIVCIMIEIPYTIQQDPVKIETPLYGADDSDLKMNRFNSLYVPLTDSNDVNDKSAMLFRYGKRPSLFRFGKRNNIFTFGKQPTDIDQNYDFETNSLYPIVSAEIFPLNSEPGDILGRRKYKKSSLLRFGKKSRDTNSLYDRSTEKDKKPHTPWRFGREEFEEIFNDNSHFIKQ